ncbi:MAG: ATP-dependent sacrificial sulfur transferase LarE [Magnetococcales bacterium]|nr:ATP-dependent sacrificial sulfur transferase LarE [Magnetococcales bacterium]
MTLDEPLRQKLLRLRQDLSRKRRTILAFSGGVDSTFLMAMLKEAGTNFLAVTAVSPTMPAHDREQSVSLARALDVGHRIIASGEMDNPRFVKNDFDRCFHCKDDLFSRLVTMAREEGFDHVVDGSTADDLYDHRPGMRAKMAHGVESPLLDAGLTKEELRLHSRTLGLPTWNRPASPCLSSRISYGEPIESEALRMIESGETWLKDHGFDIVRVRKQHHTARIEIPEEQMARFLDPGFRHETNLFFRNLGFQFISLDLEGFASGKLNRMVLK